MYHDEMNRTLVWHPQAVKIFTEALRRYYSKLTEYANSTTTAINNERERVKALEEIFSRTLTDAKDDGDFIELTMLGKNWALIHQLTQQFLSWKAQVIRESKAIPEALEHEKGEVEAARHALQLFEQLEVPRGNPIKVEFYGDKVDNSLSATGNVVNIGTLNNINGQFVGINTGTVNQNNEIEVELSKISEAITASGLSDNVKREYLADLISVNAQLAGGNANQNFVKSAFEKLRTAISVGGDLATLAALVLPHLDKLQHLIR